jgi:hypothetical protein
LKWVLAARVLMVSVVPMVQLGVLDRMVSRVLLTMVTAASAGLQVVAVASI